MPYIPVKDRVKAMNFGPNTPGELNYCITQLINEYIEEESDSMRYSFINACIGVLECCKLELYRRIAAPYEDKKCEENGDVYEV